jgi:DnaJ-class molecular chaperone
MKFGRYNIHNTEKDKHGRVECPRCDGEGLTEARDSLGDNICSTCKGDGRVTPTEEDPPPLLLHDAPKELQ